jgi:hypothetical protein
VITVTAAFNIDPGAIEGITVLCPAAHPFVLGGGFNTQVNVQVVSNHPVSEPGPPQEQGWQAVGANTTTGETIPITAYAQCSK